MAKEIPLVNFIKAKLFEKKPAEPVVYDPNYARELLLQYFKQNAQRWADVFENALNNLMNDFCSVEKGLENEFEGLKAKYFSEPYGTKELVRIKNFKVSSFVEDGIPNHVYIVFVVTYDILWGGDNGKKIEFNKTTHELKFKIYVDGNILQELFENKVFKPKKIFWVWLDTNSSLLYNYKPFNEKMSKISEISSIEKFISSAVDAIYKSLKRRGFGKVSYKSLKTIFDNRFRHRFEGDEKQLDELELAIKSVLD